IDMVCYRRHGHNEGDDPSYTQPVMYRKIRNQASVAKQYTDKLIREKVVTADEAEGIRKAYFQKLNDAFDAAQNKGEEFEVQEVSLLPSEFAQIASSRTAIDSPMVERVIRGMTTVPSDFNLHPKLKGFLDKRKELLNGAPMDWAAAEAIAFGSLLLEGT